MLLRKTQAESVNQFLPLFLKKYPNFKSLSKTNLQQLSKLLRPLGLHRTRAEAFKNLAKIIINMHNGRIPSSPDELISLPHIGRYIANAYCCIKHSRRLPIVDHNIVRLYSRVFGVRKPVEVHKDNDLWNFAKALLPRKDFKEFNWALLDISAIICKSKKPICEDCPINSICLYYKASIN